MCACKISCSNTLLSYTHALSLCTLSHMRAVLPHHVHQDRVPPIPSIRMCKGCKLASTCWHGAGGPVHMPFVFCVLPGLRSVQLWSRREWGCNHAFVCVCVCVCVCVHACVYACVCVHVPISFVSAVLQAWSSFGSLKSLSERSHHNHRSIHSYLRDTCSSFFHFAFLTCIPTHYLSLTCRAKKDLLHAWMQAG